MQTKKNQQIKPMNYLQNRTKSKIKSSPEKKWNDLKITRI